MFNIRFVHFKKVANAKSFHGFRVEENYSPQTKMPDVYLNINIA